MVFNLKKSTVKDDAKNLFEIVKSTKQLTTECQKIIYPVIQRNFYFAHPGNLLLTIICDDDKTIRQLGWLKIRKARSVRENNTTTAEIRTFNIPMLNFRAAKYYELINWEPNIISNRHAQETSQKMS